MRKRQITYKIIFVILVIFFSINSFAQEDYKVESENARDSAYSAKEKAKSGLEYYKIKNNHYYDLGKSILKIADKYYSDCQYSKALKLYNNALESFQKIPYIPTPTNTLTYTPNNTLTNTPTITFTPTVTCTPTVTYTQTLAPTNTPTSTQTPEPDFRNLHWGMSESEVKNIEKEKLDAVLPDKYCPETCRKLNYKTYLFDEYIDIEYIFLYDKLVMAIYKPQHSGIFLFDSISSSLKTKYGNVKKNNCAAISEWYSPCEIQECTDEWETKNTSILFRYNKTYCITFDKKDIFKHYEQNIYEVLFIKYCSKIHLDLFDKISKDRDEAKEKIKIKEMREYEEWKEKEEIKRKESLKYF